MEILLPEAVDARSRSVEITNWSPLYRWGGIAAYVVLGFICIQMYVFITWPPPSFEPGVAEVGAWFTWLQQRPVLGLIELDMLSIIDSALLLVFYAAVLVAMRRVSLPLVLIGGIVVCVAVSAYFPANPSLTMLALSSQHAAATTDAARASSIAAGQAAMATFMGTPFVSNYLLSAAASLIVARLMFRSNVFSRPTSWSALALGVLSLVPACFGTLGIIFSLASMVPLVLLLMLGGRRLLRLGA